MRTSIRETEVLAARIERFENDVRIVDIPHNDKDHCETQNAVAKLLELPHVGSWPVCARQRGVQHDRLIELGKFLKEELMRLHEQHFVGAHWIRRPLR